MLTEEFESKVHPGTRTYSVDHRSDWSGDFILTILDSDDPPREIRIPGEVFPLLVERMTGRAWWRK